MGRTSKARTYKLNAAFVRSIMPPEKGYVTYPDWAVPGFQLRVASTGEMSWVLRYRIAGRERSYTIGSTSSWDNRTARQRAVDLQYLIRTEGLDPLKDAERERAVYTVGALIDRYKSDHLPTLRPATQKLYGTVINGTRTRQGLYVTFKHIAVRDWSFEHIDGFHRDLTLHSPGLANVALAVMSRLVTLANHLGIIDRDPTWGVKKNPAMPRTRHLSSDERNALFRELDAYPDRELADAIRFIAFTGCRRGECNSAYWSQFDLRAGVWTRPAALVKNTRDQVVPISSVVIDLLRARPRTGWKVFPGASETRLVKAWKIICERADLHDARLYTLRHSFGSAFATGGGSLPVIGSSLAHVSTSSTAHSGII